MDGKRKQTKGKGGASEPDGLNPVERLAAKPPSAKAVNWQRRISPEDLEWMHKIRRAYHEGKFRHLNQRELVKEISEMFNVKLCRNSFIEWLRRTDDADEEG